MKYLKFSSLIVGILFILLSCSSKKEDKLLEKYLPNNFVVVSFDTIGMHFSNADQLNMSFLKKCLLNAKKEKDRANYKYSSSVKLKLASGETIVLIRYMNVILYKESSFISNCKFDDSFVKELIR